jgi:hypothetical protein
MPKEDFKKLHGSNRHSAKEEDVIVKRMMMNEGRRTPAQNFKEVGGGERERKRIRRGEKMKIRTA